MAQRANLQIYQGDDYGATVTVSNGDGSPADLTPYSAKAQIRRTVADVAPDVVAEFTITVDSPMIQLVLSHQETLLLSGNYIWDLQLTEIAGGMITTILAGAVQVSQEVTREVGKAKET